MPGSVVVFERFEDYVPRNEPPSMAAGGKVAHFDRVELLYIPDTATAIDALIAGENRLDRGSAGRHADVLRRRRYRGPPSPHGSRAIRCSLSSIISTRRSTTR